jgi:hypothetical protein
MKEGPMMDRLFQPTQKQEMLERKHWEAMKAAGAPY